MVNVSEELEEYVCNNQPAALIKESMKLWNSDRNTQLLNNITSQRNWR